MRGERRASTITHFIFNPALAGKLYWVFVTEKPRLEILTLLSQVYIVRG